MKNRVTTCLLLLLCIHFHAQDSLLSHTFKTPVEIKASNVNDLNQLDSAIASRSQSLDLGRYLDASGMANVTLYGAPGAAALLRIRGTAPDHATIVWQGLSLNSVTLGMADCSMLPIWFFDDIRSGSSNRISSPASSAIGGNIQLGSSAKNRIERKGVRFRMESNSLNNHFIGLDFSVRKGQWFMRSKLFYQFFDNQFAYTDRFVIERPRSIQENNNGYFLGIMQQMERSTRLGRLTIDGFATQRQMQIPSIMGIQNAVRQRQWDNQQRAVIRLESKNKDSLVDSSGSFHHWSWASSLSWLRDEQIYHSANTSGTNEIQSSVIANQGVAGFEGGYSTKKWGANTAMQFFAVQAIYDHRRVIEQVFPVFSGKIWKVIGIHSLRLESRYESRSQLVKVPSLNFYHRIDLINASSYLEWSVGQKIRIPDFNELYWTPGGNPQLHPERSKNGSLRFGKSIHNRMNREVVFLDIQTYYQDVAQWIQWLPGANGIWSPINYKRVRSSGVEASVKLTQFIGQWKLQISSRYQWVVAKGTNDSRWSENVFNMVYQARNKVFISADVIYKNWNTSLSYRYTGTRYTDEANSPYLQLNPYSVFDFSIGRNIALANGQFNLQFKIDNATNTSYETVRSYAIPGRVYGIAITTNLN